MPSALTSAFRSVEHTRAPSTHRSPLDISKASHRVTGMLIFCERCIGCFARCLLQDRPSTRADHSTPLELLHQHRTNLHEASFSNDGISCNALRTHRLTVAPCTDTGAIERIKKRSSYHSLVDLSMRTTQHPVYFRFDHSRSHPPGIPTVVSGGGNKAKQQQLKKEVLRQATL